MPLEIGYWNIRGVSTLYKLKKKYLNLYHSGYHVLYRRSLMIDYALAASTLKAGEGLMKHPLCFRKGDLAGP